MLKTVSSIVNAIGALNYKGTWNASTNTPALASGVGTKGDYYVVSVAGATNLDGETLWGVGDWAVFNGAVWQRLEGGSTINATTVSASTSVTTPIVQSSTSAGTTLKNASGTTCIQYGAGGGTNVTIEAAINMNGANAHIEMSPTGTGHVTIKPTAVGDMDNMIIGATTPLAGTFTSLTSKGNTILGNASTDTLNVGNGGLIKDASGNLTLVGNMKAGQYYTDKGNSGSLANSTATTIYTVSGVCVVTVGAFLEAGQGSPSLYAATATVIYDGVAGRIVSNNGALLTLTLSGANIQVTQTSGSTQATGAAWSVLVQKMQ